MDSFLFKSPSPGAQVDVTTEDEMTSVDLTAVWGSGGVALHLDAIWGSGGVALDGEVNNLGQDESIELFDAIG